MQTSIGNAQAETTSTRGSWIAGASVRKIAIVSLAAALFSCLSIINFPLSQYALVLIEIAVSLILFLLLSCLFVNRDIHGKKRSLFLLEALLLCCFLAVLDAGGFYDSFLDDFLTTVSLSATLHSSSWFDTASSACQMFLTECYVLSRFIVLAVFSGLAEPKSVCSRRFVLRFFILTLAVCSAQCITVSLPVGIAALIFSEPIMSGSGGPLSTVIAFYSRFGVVFCEIFVFLLAVNRRALFEPAVANYHGASSVRCATLVLCGIVVVAALFFGFLHPFDTATSFTSDMASLEETLTAVFEKNTSARGNFYDVFDPVIAIYGRTTPALFLEFIAFFVVGLLVFLFAKRAEKVSLRVPSVILPLLATAFLCTLGNESMLLLLYTDFYDTLYMSPVACTVFNMIGSGLSAFTLVCVSCSLALGTGDDDDIEGVDFIETVDVALQGEGSDLRDIR